MSSRPGSRLFTIRYCSEFPPHLKTTGLLALGTDLLLPNWQCFRLLKCHFQSSGAGSVILYYWSIFIPRIPRGGCFAIFFFFFLTFLPGGPKHWDLCWFIPYSSVLVLHCRLGASVWSLLSTDRNAGRCGGYSRGWCKGWLDFPTVFLL